MASAIGSPTAFTAKTLQLLSREGVIQALRGQDGGYRIPGQRIPEIRLIDIVYAIDGKSIYADCVLGLRICSHQNPCPAHNRFIAVRDQLKAALEQTHLGNLSDSVMQGESILLI